MLHEDFVPETKTIVMKGKPVITVRGLSLTDVSTVIRFHLSEMEKLFAMYQEHETAVLLGGKREEFLLRLLTDAPDIVFTLLATAADEPASMDKVAKLPFAVQLDALSAVLNLTFEESGGPKNFVATLQTLFGSLIPTLTTGSLPKAA